LNINTEPAITALSATRGTLDATPVSIVESDETAHTFNVAFSVFDPDDGSNPVDALGEISLNGGVTFTALPTVRVAANGSGFSFPVPASAIATTVSANTIVRLHAVDGVTINADPLDPTRAALGTGPKAQTAAFTFDDSRPLPAIAGPTFTQTQKKDV